MSVESNIKKVATELIGELGGQWLATSLRNDIDNHVEAAKQAALSLSSKLQTLAEYLATNGADASFNSLGVVQGRGAELDRLLGQIAVMRDMMNTLASNVKP